MNCWKKGLSVELACREVGISDPTYYKWRHRYDGMSVDDAKELKELRVENTKLKRLVANEEFAGSNSRQVHQENQPNNCKNAATAGL